MASAKLFGIGLGPLAVIGLILLFVFAPSTFRQIPFLGGLAGNGGQIPLQGPVNVNLKNILTGADIASGQNPTVEVYKLGSTTPYDIIDADPDTASDSAQTFKSGETYFMVACSGGAAHTSGVGCEGTDAGVREFSPDDAVRGVSVFIPFATSPQQTQHDIVISLNENFDDGSGEDITWIVVSGTESLTDNDGSTTDNDYGGDGGVGVAAEVEEFTGTQTHSVRIANANDNRGWNEAFTLPDSGNTLGLRAIAQLRNENGTGTARITDVKNLFSTGGASPTNWYDLGDASQCIVREVVGTLIKQQGICNYSFTIEHGTYTSASAFTQVTIYLVQYLDTGYFEQTGTANPEAFLDAATTDCMFDFFITDA